MIIQEITCRFCGVVTGSMSFKNGTPQAFIDFEMNKFADSRCDTHLTQFGDYKEMNTYFLQNIGPQEEFEVMMEESEYKVDKLVESLLYKYPEKVLTFDTGHERIKTEKTALLKRLNIDKKELSEQVDFINKNKVV